MEIDVSHSFTRLKIRHLMRWIPQSSREKPRIARIHRIADGVIFSPRREVNILLVLNPYSTVIDPNCY
jgi:hypothetical protein